MKEAAKVGKRDAVQASAPRSAVVEATDGGGMLSPSHVTGGVEGYAEFGSRNTRLLRAELSQVSVWEMRHCRAGSPPKFPNRDSSESLRQALM